MSKPASHRWSGWLVAVVLASLAAPARAGSDPAAVRVALRDRGEVQVLLRHGFDVVAVHASDRGAAAEVLASARDLQRLRRLGFDARRLPPPRTAAATFPVSTGLPPGFGQGAMGGYYTFDEVVALLDHYAAAYPTVVGAKQVIGASVEGRPIYAVKVSDHPGAAEAEPRVLIDALHHAREPTSMQTLVLLLHRLATGYGADPEITALVNEREIWLVPVVNPDGYVFNQATHPQGGGLWRKNRRMLPGGCVGVDLNRNYPAGFAADDVGSSGDPCVESYRGPAPLSEPETQALAAFAAAQGFTTVCTLHAHGRLMMHPFGYAPLPLAHAAQYQEHGAEMAAWNGYQAGAIQEVLYPANGNAVDHHHAAHGSRAWTFEVGGSFWPPPAEMIATAQENLEPLLLLARYAGSWIKPGGMAWQEVAGDGDGFADPGEVLDLLIELKNRGIAPTAGLVAAHLLGTGSSLTVVNGTAALPALGAAAATSLGPGALRVQVAPDAVPGQRIALDLRVDWDAVSIAYPVALDVGTPRTLLRDDLEHDLGWAAKDPGDDAWTGMWTRVDPDLVVQDGQIAQPDDDATPAPGVRCFVTGNNGSAPGQDDVDDGKVTLRTPLFDLSGTTAPVVRYARFYWCSKGDDPFTVEASNDGGAHWVQLEQVKGSQNAWKVVEHRLADFLPPTDRMCLRFIAQDPDNGSVTEAAVDELEVLDYGTAPRLTAFGTAKPGARVELQLAAPTGPFWMLAATKPGSAHVPGITGALLLDPAGFVLAGQGLSSGDLLRMPLQVPSSPAFIGVQAHFQVLALMPGPAFSNAASITVQAP